MGRNKAQSDVKKDKQVKVRVNDYDLDILEALKEHMGISKSEITRIAWQRLYNHIKKLQ